MGKLTLAVFCLMAATLQAQDWEIGGFGGYGYSFKRTVNAPGGDADVRTKPGLTLGVVGGGDTHKYWSGEVRYLYRYSDLEVSGNGQKASLGAYTHIVHADFLGHFTPKGSKTRPFIAVGAGVKILQGTGIESSGQALGDKVALTATKQVLGVLDVGAGIKYDVKEHFRLRVEVRDYISGAPNKVFAPAPGASLGGVWNDVIGTVGLSYIW